MPARCQAGPDTDQEGPKTGLGLKAVWHGAEALGDVVGLAKGAPRQAAQAGAPSTSGKLDRAQALAMIREDYDSNYFVSGVGDMSAYDENCLFADPFAGFNGVARFKKNVSNLGGLLSDIKLDLYGWEEAEGSLVTRWRFSGVLGLPWRPLLAAGGSTTHVFDPETGKVVKHIEAWDVEPGKVVRGLLKPSARFPGNAWEALALALYEGDGKAVWWALSGPTLRVAAAATALDVGSKLVLGQGLPGGWEAGLFALLGGCVLTEVIKFSAGLQGGDTGTGGRF